jgi:hypothetical protein
MGGCSSVTTMKELQVRLPLPMQSWTLTVVAGRFELFLDLLYVGILSSFADTLVEEISGAKLVKYLVRRAQGTSLRFPQESIH